MGLNKPLLGFNNQFIVNKLFAARHGRISAGAIRTKIPIEIYSLLLLNPALIFYSLGENYG